MTKPMKASVEIKLIKEIVKNLKCVHCNQPFSDSNVFSYIGWKEVRISQMCEKCFDELFVDRETEK